MTNVAELQRVMTFIKDHPEKHDQKVWTNNCGTAACLAGWTCLLNGYHVDTEEVLRPTYDSSFSIFSYPVAGGPVISDDGTKGHIRHLSRDILDLCPNDADILFWSTNTIEQLELMVKDLANGEHLHDHWEFARDEYGDEMDHYVRREQEPVA